MPSSLKRASTSRRPASSRNSTDLGKKAASSSSGLPRRCCTDLTSGSLARLPEVKSVQHRLGNPEELLAAFFPKSVLFLDDAGRREVEARLSDDGIRRRVSELRRQLSTPQALSVKELAKLDPLGLSDLLLGHVASSRGTLQVDWASGYYLSRDHRLLLVLAEPRRPPQDIPFDERLIHESEQSWPALSGAGAASPVPAVRPGR